MNRHWYSLAAVLLLAGPAFAQIDHPQPKAAGKKFWLLTGATGAVGAADFARTRHCLDNRTCKEGNPLLGPHPSFARQAGIGLAFHGGAAWAGYELKKRHKWYWWAPQAALLSAHVYALTRTRTNR